MHGTCLLLLLLLRRTDKEVVRLHLVKLLLPDPRTRINRMYRLLGQAREDDLTGAAALQWEKAAE